MKTKTILFIMITCITLIGCTNKNTIQNNYPDYYIAEYKDRYTEYKNNNQSLTMEDVITRVNIGLDKPFYTNTKETKYLNTEYILSNKYLYMPSNYVPNNLTTINSKYSNENKKLVDIACKSFENLANDAATSGYTIRAISAYRSYKYQEILYNKYKDQDGEILADTYSARPGYSEHQTGLVIDVDNGKIDFNNFELTDEFKWMKNNAYKYGFILRYPKGKEKITGYTYEAWHYRYVGLEVAKYIYENDITFDEYYVRFIENKY